MNRFLKIIIFLFLNLSLLNCSQVLETVTLSVNADDPTKQEDFNVVEKTLSLREASRQKTAFYSRIVTQNGPGSKARNISETAALTSNFPDIFYKTEYKIGVGDTLTYSRLIDNNISEERSETNWPPENTNSKYKLGIGDVLALTRLQEIDKQLSINNDSISSQTNNQSTVSQSIIEASGRIGSDGSLLLLEVGRLEANGKTLNELRSEVRNILIRDGSSPEFQLEITQFNSQKAYLTVNERSSVISLSDKQKNLREILSSAGKGTKPGVITKINLQREQKIYSTKLREIFNKDAEEVLIKNNDHIFVEDNLSNVFKTEAIVGQTGDIVIEGIGQINVMGKTLDEVRQSISSIIERLPNSDNTFQIEVTDFSSQRALISIPGQSGGIGQNSGIIPITNRKQPLDEILIQSGVSPDGNMITRIELHRNDQIFTFTLRDLINKPEGPVYLEPDDKVYVEKLTYKPNKVFILGGVSPSIFNINPAIRETLADILFTSNGVLGSSSAKRSEVYLLRGSNPVVAYHLDAQNPTRLIVADAMELRPNDILYVAEQPIVSFNRALGTIAPLRILIRDIQNENIP